jgi:hypothetical protein
LIGVNGGRAGAGAAAEPAAAPVARTASLGTAPAHGTVTIGKDGGFTYKPTAGFEGTDTFTYMITGGTTAGQPSTVDIVVK